MQERRLELVKQTRISLRTTDRLLSGGNRGVPPQFTVSQVPEIGHGLHMVQGYLAHGCLAHEKKSSPLGHP